MDFDFLPQLPKSDLDDRNFQDLMDECLLRIPRYCPEWTNYNPSDPGVTLIELFAWLTDQMLMRFNQIPRRHYVAFLELLGIRLQPPTPARTEITVYLSASLPQAYVIPANIEVATVRTETDEAIVFSTDRPLEIGIPQIRHLLTAPTDQSPPANLRDRLSGFWNQTPEGQWQGRELALFGDPPRPHNCFYLVFEPVQPIAGNVIALTVKGEAATSTGINPEAPPRQWEAWNGTHWVNVLLQPADDQTEGFSFNQLTRDGGNPLQGADIIFHLPQSWPVTQFANYQGRWLRCRYREPDHTQPAYSRSPRIVGLAVRSIGGTVDASQCSLVTHELLGESDGTPGQQFQLQGVPVLPRTEQEYLLVTPPGEAPQVWREVADFASSDSGSFHYQLDSLTGTIQFGPLIREPGQLKVQTAFRRRSQFPNLSPLPALPSERPAMERQYGAVPPRGAKLEMVAYRTGGGQQGNVQAGTITITKTAVPYVSRVINHVAARNGAEGESLEEAVVRVPRLLRTRDRAVTTEDFETIALAAGAGAIARARCLSPQDATELSRGEVKLLLVPQIDPRVIEQGEGMAPDGFAISPQLQQQIRAYLDERRLLGVEVNYGQPNYVGVAVQAEVSLNPEYNHPLAQSTILNQLETALYYFLNPITGGPDRNGWPFGRPVYPSDIVQVLQRIDGVRYLGTIQLFEMQPLDNGEWTRVLPKEPIIQPGALGLICSWRHARLSRHVIDIIPDTLVTR